MSAKNVLIQMEEIFLKNTKVLLFRDTSGLPLVLHRKQFDCQFSPSQWERKKHPDLEIHISKVWQNKLLNSRIYDGKKFRFGTVNITERETIQLQLGLTTYKDIIGTNQSEESNIWIRKGIEDHNDAKSYMSNGLGNGVVVFTKDEYLVVIKRAPWTGECPDMYDRPGGHAEPDKISFDDQNGLNESVTNEIWFSPLDELEAEVGVTKQDITNYRFLGASFNLQYAGRPSLEFWAKLNIDSKEVRKRYDKGNHIEADESSSLILLPKKKVLEIIDIQECQFDSTLATSKIVKSDELQDFFHKCTPALQGALYLYATNKCALEALE